MIMLVLLARLFMRRQVFLMPVRPGGIVRMLRQIAQLSFAMLM